MNHNLLLPKVFISIKPLPDNLELTVLFVMYNQAMCQIIKNNNNMGSLYNIINMFVVIKLVTIYQANIYFSLNPD